MLTGALAPAAANGLDSGAVSVGQASARASWQDQITLSSPGRDGRTARVAIEFDLEGYLDPTGGAEAMVAFTMEFDHPAFLRTVRQSVTVAYGGSQKSALAPPRIQTGLQNGEFVFQAGDPFFLTVLRTAVLEFPVGTALGVSARLETNANRDLQAGGAPGSAEANFLEHVHVAGRAVGERPGSRERALRPALSGRVQLRVGRRRRLPQRDRPRAGHRRPPRRRARDDGGVGTTAPRCEELTVAGVPGRPAPSLRPYAGFLGHDRNVVPAGVVIPGRCGERPLTRGGIAPCSA